MEIVAWVVSLALFLAIWMGLMWFLEVPFSVWQFVAIGAALTFAYGLYARVTPLIVAALPGAVVALILRRRERHRRT